MAEMQQRITKQDIQKLKANRELMRRSELTGPASMLSGEMNPIVRRFAQETFMQMKVLEPETFRDKNIPDWEKAIRQYLMTRRPEFRKELIAQLQKRYGGSQGGEGSPPKILMMGAQKEMPRSSSPVRSGVMRAMGNR